MAKAVAGDDGWYSFREPVAPGAHEPRSPPAVSRGSVRRPKTPPTRMHERVHSSVLLVTCLGAAQLTGQEQGDVEKIVATAKAKLAAVGYEVPAKVGVSTRTAQQVIADIDAQQELLFPRHVFELQHELLSALGLKAGKDARALRRQSVAAMARGLSAYYEPVQKTFVLLQSATRDMNEVLAGSSLPLVVHELVHGVQDGREGGLAAFFDAEHGSLDFAQARRCVMEGEAEVASVLALHGEAAVRRLLADTGTLDKLFTGELTGLLYQHGRRFVAASFVSGGRAAVVGLWRAAPGSTEQVLHPDKLGKDLPTATVVPPLPGCERLHATAFGELLIYHLLRQLGLDTTTAAIAAAGWDGDELAVLQHDASKSTVVAWRSVWDRPEDAAAFAKALPVTNYGRRDIAQRLLPADAANQTSAAARARALTPRERTLIGLHPPAFYDG